MECKKKRQEVGMCSPFGSQHREVLMMAQEPSLVGVEEVKVSARGVGGLDVEEKGQRRASWIDQSMGPFYRYRRASTSTSATASSSSSGGAAAAAVGMPDNPRGFAAFFRSLPAPSSTGASSTTKRTFRFFARDQGGFYSSHGPEALEVARRFYSTQTVVRQQAGLPSLSVSHKLFASRVLPALLASGAAVEIWEPAAGAGGPGGKEEWVLAKRGSPGNTLALEELMLSSSSADGAEAEAEAAALLGTSVMMAVQAQGGKHGKPLVLGVAVANASFRTLAVGELEDTTELKALEALAVQVGAKECLVICREEEAGAEGGKKEEDYLGKSILDVMTRCDVLCTRLGKEAFSLGPKGKGAVGASGSASSFFLEEIRTLMEGRHEGPSSSSAASSVIRPWESEHGAVLAEMAPMKLALASAHALLSHLDLLQDEDQEAGARGESEGGGSGWDASILSLAHSLQFDAMAARALTVFPEAGRADSMYRGSEGVGGGGQQQQQQLSLFSILNKTRTAAGARCLKRWLQRPLFAVAPIRARQSILSLLRGDPSLLSTLQECYGAASLTGTGRGSVFRSTPDLERTAQRFLSFSSSSPSASRGKLGLRDLLEVYTAALTLGRLSQTLSSSVPEGACSALDAALRAPLAKVVGGLARFQALVEEVLDIDRLVATHGREVAVKPAFDPSLLRLRDEMEEGKRRMEGMAKEAGKKVYGQVKDADKKVKLDWSAVHQHHFRVTKKDQPALKRIAASLEVQTLSVQKQGQLFTTPSLRKLSQRWAAQQAEYSRVQEGIVSQAVAVARTYTKLMQQGGRLLAEADVFLSLAQVANALDWCCPTLLDDEDGSKQELHITQLRHPVVEAALPSASDFIPNDVHLSAVSSSPSSTTSTASPAFRGGCLSLVTGPNCGGKSTYIRSVGVAVLLAQVGACVPAAGMEWTLVDKVLCRVGASDNQLQGVSTFMAEMLETRALLAAATPRSLVIVDELGRGTSTFDGFGLAWAVAEQLAGSAALQCRTLFATHFHELCDMEKALPPGRVQNLHFSAETPAPTSPSSSPTELTLTYQVRPGPCDRSFGVHVARLAKFPEEVVREAQVRVEALQAEGAQGLTPEQQRRLAAKKRELEGEERRRQKRAKVGERERRRKVVAALAALPPLEDLPLGEALERVVVVAEGGATGEIGAGGGTK